MKRLELLIFDFDDTIVHTGIDYMGLKKQIVKHLKSNGYSSLLDSVTPPSIAKYLEVIKEKEGVQSRLYQELMEEVELFEVQGVENATMDPSYNKLFHDLGKNFKLALLTNNSKKSVVKLMNRFNLSHYFDLIITRDDIPIMKPNPAGLQKILNHFDMSPKEAIFIGDSYIDMLASQAADIQFIGIGNRWDNRDRAYKYQITMIIQNLNEIKHIIGHNCLLS